MDNLTGYGSDGDEGEQKALSIQVWHFILQILALDRII